MKTKVMFRKMQGQILALFPAEAGIPSSHICSCYAHIGQHSSADLNYCISKSKPANESEYKSLYTELTKLGYNLIVVKRSTQADYTNRLAQIK